jgi:hypothetical protein
MALRFEYPNVPKVPENAYGCSPEESGDTGGEREHGGKQRGK